MNELTYPQAVLLGIVQGATEFLPVSSSGHLAITQEILNLDAASDNMLLFDVCTHLGTLAAIVIVFSRVFFKFLQRLRRESSPVYTGRRVAWWIAVLAVVANIPTAAIGLLFKDQLEAQFGEPKSIGAALLITGVLLWIAEKCRRPQIGWRRFAWWKAVLIGTVQGCAIMPGISRSGSTISSAIMLGIRRRWAAEFSFIIAIPAFLGAAAIKIKEALNASQAAALAIDWPPILIGSLVAFATGAIALILLLTVTRKAKLHLFSWYCWAVGVLLIVGLI